MSAPNVVHLVLRKGVYVQGIVGVFCTPEDAGRAARAALEEERDSYHSFEVHDLELDERIVLETCGPTAVEHNRETLRITWRQPEDKP